MTTKNKIIIIALSLMLISIIVLTVSNKQEPVTTQSTWLQQLNNDISIVESEVIRTKQIYISWYNQRKDSVDKLNFLYSQKKSIMSWATKDFITSQ